MNSNSSVIDGSLKTQKAQPVASALPFLKWAGGKGQLLLQYNSFFPKEFNTYFEPFLGGGAVYFRIKPRGAVLSDVNEELINAYVVVRDDVENLIKLLETHENSKEYFYSIRSMNPEGLTPSVRAARFIFLNRTCYNGLYRVNAKGEFNVPFGRYKKPLVINTDNLRNVSNQLNKAKIISGDFETVLQSAGESDFVYFDPPYLPLSKTSSFTGYAQNGFGELEQIRLGRVFKELVGRGCLLMLTNSDTQYIREIYKDFNISTVNARRTINCKVNGRKNIKELVIRNYS